MPGLASYRAEPRAGSGERRGTVDVDGGSRPRGQPTREEHPAGCEVVRFNHGGVRQRRGRGGMAAELAYGRTVLRIRMRDGGP
jgi:hypothetical protein